MKKLNTILYITFVFILLLNCKFHKIPPKKVFGSNYFFSKIHTDMDSLGMLNINDINNLKDFDISYDIYNYKNSKRTHMEDCITIDDYNNIKFFAVFDGHGGEETSKYLKKHFSKFLLTKLKNKNIQDFPKIIKKSFLEFDKSFYEKSNYKVVNENKKKRGYPGSTVNIVLIINNFIIFVNLGDSRSAYYENGKFIFSTEDHTPDTIKETERIEKSYKGYIDEDSNRVYSPSTKSRLNLTRTIGDYGFKEIKINNKYQYNDKNPPISFDPDINIFKLNPQKRYKIIIGSDGFWDYYRNKYSKVYKLSEQKPKKIEKAISVNCYHDNTSLIILDLKPKK